MTTPEDAYNELSCYVAEHGDLSFILQHVVDAYAAQQADEHTKPIQLAFSLIGLYLHVEEQFSGRQVQRTHQLLAQRKQTWPTFSLPRNRGSITAADVMAAPPGPERDHAIHQWCVSVWDAYRDNHQAVASLLRDRGIF